jgi:hypothetical protein
VIPPTRNEREGFAPTSVAGRRLCQRIVDGSGEDYLYPAGWFEPIKLSVKLREALEMAS